MLVDCNSNLTNPIKSILVYNHNFLKLYQISNLDSPFIKDSREINLKELHDHILKSIPNMSNEMLSSSSILHISYDEYIFIVLANTASSNHIHTYIFLQLKLLENFNLELIHALPIINPSIEKFEKAIIKVLSESLILVSLDSTLYIINSHAPSINPVFSSIDNAFPLNISFSRKHKNCIVLYSNLKTYSTVLDNIEETLNSTLANSTILTDYESSINQSVADNTAILNPLNWSEDHLSHFDMAFKKFINKQRDLSFHMVSNPLPLNILSSLITKYSDIIINSNQSSNYTNSNVFFVNEFQSLDRKLQWITDMHEEFFKFLKDSALWNRLWDCDQTKCCADIAVVHVLRNREKSKLCLLTHQSSNNNKIFIEALSQINDGDLNNSIDFSNKYTPQPSSIHNICTNIVDIESKFVAILPANGIDSIIDIITTFFINILTVFNESLNELGVALNNLRKSNVEFVGLNPAVDTWCLVNHACVIESFIKHICLYNEKLFNQKPPSHSSNFLLLVKKFLTVLKIVSEVVTNHKITANVVYTNSVNQIIDSFEKCNFIEHALDISTYLFSFEHTVRLCVRYEKFNFLKSFKEKWSEYNFDKYIYEWLAKEKCWKILVKEIDAKNINEIISQIPELQWVYCLKENNIDQMKQSLCSLIESENSLFYKKTFCSLYTLAHFIQPEEQFSSRVEYFTNLIKFQQCEKNQENQKYIWRGFSNEKVESIEYTIRRNLFESDLIINDEIILKAFTLLLQSKCEEYLFKNIATMIWSAAAFADDLVKNTSLIIQSTCQSDSLLYKCFKILIQEQMTSLISNNLQNDVSTFLMDHSDQPLPPTFFNRMASIIEIAQDSLTN